MLLKQNSLGKKQKKVNINLFRAIKTLMKQKMQITSSHSLNEHQLQLIGMNQYQKYKADNSRIEKKQFYQNKKQLLLTTSQKLVFMKNQFFIENLPQMEEIKEYSQNIESRMLQGQESILNKQINEIPKINDFSINQVSSEFVQTDLQRSSTQNKQGTQKQQNSRSIFAVWNPHDYGPVTWNIWVMILICLQMLMIPFVLSFNIDDPVLNALDEAMNYCFILDLLLQFNIAIYEKGHLVYNRWKITVTYLKCWFWIDLVSSFPYDYIFDNPSMQQQAQLIRFLRFFKFIKVLRLLRAMKLKKIMAKLEEYLSNKGTLFLILQILKRFLLVLCISHWCACMWNLFGDGTESWDYTYITSIYYTTTTLITVGYGDIHAFNFEEQIFVIFLMLFASALFGYFTNTVMALFEDENADFLKIEGDIKKYMKLKNLSKSLQFRVLNYLEWIQLDRLKSEQLQISLLGNISTNLKSELVCLINGKIVKELPFFEKKYFSVPLITNIAYAMQECVYGPEETVIQEGTYGTEMYYIIYGTVGVYHNKNKIFQLQKQGYFGEIGLFADLPRSASIITEDYVNLLGLNRERLLSIVSLLSYDFEKYHEMKYVKTSNLLYYQQIEIEKQYQCLFINCYVCDKYHIAKCCPEAHYIPQKNKIIRQMTTNFTQIERKNKPRTKNALYYLRSKIHLRALKRYHMQNMKKYLQGLDINQSFILDYQENKILMRISFNIDQVRNYDHFLPQYNISEVQEIYNNKVEQILDDKIRKRMADIYMKQSEIKGKTGRKVIQRYQPPNQTIQGKFQEVVQKSLRNVHLQVNRQQSQSILFSPQIRMQTNRLQNLVRFRKYVNTTENQINQEGSIQRLKQIPIYKKEQKISEASPLKRSYSDQSIRKPSKLNKKMLTIHISPTIIQNFK